VGIPQEQQQALLGDNVTLNAQSLNRRLNPEIRVGGQQHVDEAVVLPECKVMLGNEHLKLRLLQDVKCGGRSVFSPRCHELNEQEIFLQLRIAQVTVRDGRENNLAIRRVARKAPQQLAAIEKEECGLLKSANSFRRAGT
jgi:hypothetical protein